MNKEQQKSGLEESKISETHSNNYENLQGFIKNKSLIFLNIVSYISLSFVVFGILILGFLVAPVIFKNIVPRSLGSEIMTDLFLRFYPLAFLSILVTIGAEVLKFLILSKELLKSKLWLLKILIIMVITFLSGYSSNILLPGINHLIIHHKGPTLWTNNEFIILHKRSEDFAKAIFVLGLIPLCIMVTGKKYSS